MRKTESNDCIRMRVCMIVRRFFVVFLVCGLAGVFFLLFFSPSDGIIVGGSMILWLDWFSSLWRKC